MDKNKKFLIITISLLLVGLTLLGSLTIYFDPLQVFRKTSYGGGEQRQINLGIAKNHNYEIAIIGTSTSENALRKDINDIFGMDGINLSLSGSSNYEQRRMLKIILETKKVKKIIYGLDVFSYNREMDEERASIPEYIKKPNQLEIVKYLVNFDSIKQAIKFIVRGQNKNWIDKHSYWGDLYTYSKENTLNFNPELQFGAQNLGAIREFKEGYSLEKMKNNFDEFLKITQKDENVEYDIYFPPYASLWWYFAYKYDCLDTIFEFKKYIMDSVENKENIKIYDFQTDYEIVENLDNYKDIVHYGPKINREILMDIKDSKNLVDTELYSESENKFIEKMKIWEFEFKEFKDL